MLSLRQSLATIGKPPPIRIPRDISIPCKSLRDTLIAWNHIPYALLIIAPQEFVEAVMPLAAHKNNIGIPTKILSLEQIYQTYRGRDEAEKVKRCLALFQPNNGVRYAMLVGDGDRFPSRYIKWWNKISDSDPQCSTLYVPVDLYYAALFKKDGSFDDWDGNHNGYFGEIPQDSSSDPINPDNVNVIPNLAVGRIPASTVPEVKVYVSKVINYERGTYGSSWAKTVLLVAATNRIGNPCVILEDIEAKYLRDFIVHKLYQRDRVSLREWLATIGKTPPIRIPRDITMCSKSLRVSLFHLRPHPCQKTEELNPEAINAYINQGTRFVCYSGHGGRDGWGIPNGGYGFNNVASLSNSGKLPVVFSTGCDTGSFTTIPPFNTYRDINGTQHKGTNDGEVFKSTPPQPACLQPKEYESMAEEMTVKRETGAVAYIGSVTTGHVGEALLQLFLKSVSAGRETLGDMWLGMLNEYYRQHVPPNPSTAANKLGFEVTYFLEPWRFHLFGDPSLRVSQKIG